MRILIFALATSLICSHILAQTDTIRQSSIQLMGGAVNNRMVDEGLTFNRQSFTGTSFKFFADYERRRSKHMLLASFEINGGKVNMGGEQVSSNIDNGQIAFSYLFKTATYKFLGRKSTLYIGPKISTTINYLSAPRLDNETVLAIHGLYLHAFQQIQLNKSSFLEASISLPTVAFSRRIVLDGGLYPLDDDDFKTILFDEAEFSFAKMMEFNAVYSKRLSPLTYFNLRYRFAYMANYQFGDFNFYSNELLAGFKFYFKNE